MRRAVLRPVDPHQRAWRIVAIGLAAVWGTVVVLDVLPDPGDRASDGRPEQGAARDVGDVGGGGAEAGDGGAVTTVPVLAPRVAGRAASPVGSLRRSPAGPSPALAPGAPASPSLGGGPTASAAAPSTAAPPTTAPRGQPVTPEPVTQELPEAVAPVEPPPVTLPAPDDDAVDLEAEEPEDEPKPEDDDGRPGRGLGRGRGRGGDDTRNGPGGPGPG